MSAPVALHHVESGATDGPALVLLNSLGTTLEMWKPQVAALGERHRLIRTDTRGHGESPVPPGPYAMADLARDVVRLLDELGIARADVCGLSLGGMIAMWLAARAPERVGRLVLCCTSACLSPAGGWTERAALVRGSGMDAVADMVVGRWFTPGHAGSYPGLVAGYRAMIAATPAEGYASCCEAIAGFDLRDELPSIAAPTLVVAGAEDPAIPAADTGGIAAAIPGARLVEVEDAAHLVNVEQAAVVTRLILEHLGDRERHG